MREGVIDLISYFILGLDIGTVTWVSEINHASYGLILCGVTLSKDVLILVLIMF